MKHKPCLSLSWCRVQGHSVLLFLLISKARDGHCVKGYGVHHISGIVKEMPGELGRLRRKEERKMGEEGRQKLKEEGKRREERRREKEVKEREGRRGGEGTRKERMRSYT